MASIGIIDYGALKISLLKVSDSEEPCWIYTQLQVDGDRGSSFSHFFTLSRPDILELVGIARSLVPDDVESAEFESTDADLKIVWQRNDQILDTAINYGEPQLKQTTKRIKLLPNKLSEFADKLESELLALMEQAAT